MSDQVTHPSPDELSAFNLGQLPPETASQVEDHISECEPCCETLLGLASNDTFVALLKEAHQPVDESEYATFVTENATRTKSTQPTVPETLTKHTRYEIVRLIGKGGMGDVFQARHRMMDRTVAIKVINHEFIRKSQAVDRFHREVKAAARLSHPNIVTAYDAEQAGDLHFLVMEYVDGIDLARLVKEKGRLRSQEACDFARQAAIGLQHAHEQGMVHRDIKPHNLMVSTDGIVKILDFGLASLAPGVLLDEDTTETSGELTVAGSIVGTPDFISPEQAQDAHQADIRSDIYSLGATLYYLLSGRAPFADASVIEKLKRHAEQEPVPLEHLQIEIPGELAEVIRKMMAKDPDERYQTPQEVADALDKVSARLRATSDCQKRLPLTAEMGSDQTKSVRSVAEILMAATVCNMIWVAIVLSNVFYNLGGFTDSPFWETLGGPLFYGSLIELPLVLMQGFGAWRMRRFESYGWSKIAAILAVIPVTPVNIVLGVFAGLGALWQLSQPEVKVLFESDDRILGNATRLPSSAGTAIARSGSGWTFRRIVCLAFFSFLSVLAGVFYIQLGKTTLKFEVLDPNIQVRFSDEAVHFQDREGANTTFSVKPGETQEFVVEQNGAVVETDSLVLNRGDKVVLKIDVMEGEIVVTSSVPDVDLLRKSAVLPSERTPKRRTTESDDKPDFQFKPEAIAAFDRGADYPKRAPFDRLRWEGSLMKARVRGTWYELQEVDGVPVNEIIAFCREIEGDRWMKRFAEDLVQVLSLLEHPPGGTVDLKVKDEETGKTILLKKVPMTEANRRELREEGNTSQDYALEFDAKSSVVALPIRYDGSHPITMECLVQLPDSGNGNQMLISDVGPKWPGFMLVLRGEIQGHVELLLYSEKWEMLNLRSKERYVFGETVHIAVVFSNDAVSLFVNGRLQQSRQLSSEIRYLPSPNRIGIGGFHDNDGSVYNTTIGLIDEVRISKIARYDKDFTPVKRFEADDDTMALYHFDEGDGTIARDSSGNKLDGKVIGAKWVEWPKESESPEVSKDSLEIYDSLLVMLKNIPDADDSDDAWNKFLSKNTLLPAYSDAVDGGDIFLALGRNALVLLDCLPPESIDSLLKHGFLKWKATSLTPILQTLTLPANPRDQPGSTAVTPDVGFAVLNFPDSNQQCFVFFVGESPSSYPAITIVPLLGDQREVNLHRKRIMLEQQIRKFLNKPESLLPASPDQTSQSSAVIRRFQGHEGYISGLAATRDGKTMVSGSRDGTIRVWNIADGTTTHVFKLPEDYPARVAVSPEGTYVAASTHGRLVFLWRVSDERLIRTMAGQTMAIAFVDDEHLLTGDAEDFAGKLWHVESGDLIREFQGHTKGIYFYSLTPDATRVLSKGSDRKWCVWDVATGEKLHELEWPDRTQDATYPLLTADGRHVLTGHRRGETGMVYADLSTGEQLRHYKNRHLNRVNVVALSPDERFALSGDEDARICLSDFKTGELIEICTDHTSGISGLFFLPDGKRFISSAGGSRWDSKTGKMIPGHDYTIRLWQLPESVSTGTTVNDAP